MAVSLAKKPLMREYTPEHIRREEETLPPKLKEYTPEHIALEPAVPLEPLKVLTSEFESQNINLCSVNLEIINSELTDKDNKSLQKMMKDTSDQISALFEIIENLSAEAERRANVGNDCYVFYENTEYFFDNIGRQIAKANRRFKRRKSLYKRKAFWTNWTKIWTSDDLSACCFRLIMGFLGGQLALLLLVKIGMWVISLL